MEVSKINFYSSMRAQSPRIRVLAKNKQYLCKENTQSVSFPRKITPLYFTPNFNGLTAKTKDVLKNQQKSFEYDIAPADIESNIPKAYYKLFSDKKINIIGAGSIFDNFLEIGNVANNLYSTKNIYLFDPKYNTSNADLNKISKYNILSDYNKITDGFAFIVSPTEFHASQVIDMIKKKGIKGIYVDKPICTTPEELKKLDDVLKTTSKPMYFGDFFFFSNLPALRLMGVPMPYKDAVQIEFDASRGKKFTKAIHDAQPYFKKDEINSVIGKIVEQGHHHLLNRSWLQSKEKGGGVLLDLQTHIFNLLNLMDLSLNRIDSAYSMKYPFIESGVPGIDSKEDMPDLKKKQRGVFRPVEQGEVEDRVIITGKINNKIPAYFECAQYMPERENFIMIEGKNGEKIRCSTDIFDKKVELLDEDNHVIARAKINVLPYSLMMHHMQKHFDDAQNNSFPMFYDIQKSTMNQIFSIKNMLQ